MEVASACYLDGIILLGKTVIRMLESEDRTRISLNIALEFFLFLSL